MPPAAELPECCVFDYREIGGTTPDTVTGLENFHFPNFGNCDQIRINRHAISGLIHYFQQLIAAIKQTESIVLLFFATHFPRNAIQNGIDQLRLIIVKKGTANINIFRHDDGNRHVFAICQFIGTSAQYCTQC